MPFIQLFPNIFGDLAWAVTASYGAVNPDSLCTKLQMRYLDCLEAYGCHKGKEKCAELFYDVCECNSSAFQRARGKDIRRERMRQYREGKLKQPFDEHPPLDSYLYM